VHLEKEYRKMKQVILDILNDNKNITEIQDNSFIKTYSNKSYQYIFKFVYTIENIDIPMVIGIPTDWDRKLIDVYIENYRELKFLPHVGNEGELCLFDLEGVLIDKNFQGLLYQTLRRVYKTLSDGLNEINKEDFIEEFEEYWRRLPNVKILKSMVAPATKSKIIKYADNKKTIKKKNKQKYIDFLEQKNQYSLVSSDLEKDFTLYNSMNNVKNGVYVYIEPEDYIYPPDWRNRLDIGYINGLLNNKFLDKSKCVQIIGKCKGELLLIFNIKQPNNCTNILGVIIQNYSIDRLSGNIRIQSNEDLIPCSVIRCDKEFLLNRGGASLNACEKKILVIGCGSIGGYLVNELVKTGLSSIDIVDRDLLKEENIYRHLLGMEYINQYKSKALVDYITKNIPNVKINSIEDNIEDAIIDGNISISEYDLIISAVGNHNLNRWINEYVHNNNIKIPVIYLWNEVLGIGSHVAFITTKYEGCYECFFGETKEGIYDKTSYCERGQSFTKKVRGCGSSYLPFSSSNSLTTAISAIEVIKNCFEGRIKDNFLISIKGDDYYFKKAGFRTSNRYNVQNEIKKSLKGDKFKKEGCLICGDK
jgi:molybdopterin/thiamine biosynthesis adenylyltransferase